MSPVLRDDGVRDDGAQGGVGQRVEQLAQHEVPDANTTPADVKAGVGVLLMEATKLKKNRK